MTRYLSILAVVLMAFVGISSARASQIEEPIAAGQDTTFIYMPNGRLDVYPPDVVKSIDRGEEKIIVTTIDGKAHSYLNVAVESVSNTAPKNKPLLTSFKFNNKFNADLYADVSCEFGANGTIQGVVPKIG